MREIELEPYMDLGHREVALYISVEGARYISDVMADEYGRTRDSGARDIAEYIEEGLG